MIEIKKPILGMPSNQIWKGYRVNLGDGTNIRFWKQLGPVSDIKLIRTVEMFCTQIWNSEEEVT